jgi:hypothetical protein
MGGRNTKFFDETPGVFDNLVFKRSLRGECVIDIDCQIAQDPELGPLAEKSMRMTKPPFLKISQKPTPK